MEPWGFNLIPVARAKFQEDSLVDVARVRDTLLNLGLVILVSLLLEGFPLSSDREFSDIRQVSVPSRAFQSPIGPWIRRRVAPPAALLPVERDGHVGV